MVGLLGAALGSGAFACGKETYGSGTVSAGSMAPTYEPGDRIVWERVDGSEVRRGDVVMFSEPGRYGPGVVMQRVIGVGGDHVACCAAVGSRRRITVNGEPVAEPYVWRGDADGLRRSYDVEVPEGRLFLLGDRRGNARDSRFFASDHDGTVPVDAVRGRVTDSPAGPALIVSGLALGAVLLVTGVGLGIGAWAVRRRARALVPPPPPWPVRPV
ncbi:signal peptidase I [Streptomyces sp. NBC_00820]|uniref:signal peptidase I n=1 Tax=Streptomyces sp. NBC_00820 TaxID=2975842 RepID=UPI002ED12B47|nr:signal peptidase I [Streptomyces sp. NBC_00820]